MMRIQRAGTLGVLLAASVHGGAIAAQAAVTITDADRAEIQALMPRYSATLGGCQAEEFADLFVPGTGSFTSGFRGRMEGREQLILLVQSERHCVAAPGTPESKRVGGGNGPATAIEVTSAGVRGVAPVNGAEYQDEFVKTPKGWKLASRTVVLAAEKAAGLNSEDFLAIQMLSKGNAGDHYEPDKNGVPRLICSGTRVDVKNGEVLGKAYLKDGSFNDEVYEKAGGKWRVKSSLHVAQGPK